VNVREALEAALDHPFRKGQLEIVAAAAHERLAQMPQACIASNAMADCPTCHGRGTVYPPALVERITEIIANHGEWWNARGKAVAVLDALNETP
jgi:hypothetical protein